MSSESEGGGLGNRSPAGLSRSPCPLCAPSGWPRPRADTPGPQPQPMDLRVGQRPPVEPPPEPTLLALQHPQRLHHHLFLAGLQPQRSAEPMRVKLELPRSLEPRRGPALPSASTSVLNSSPPPHSSQWTRRCPSCRWGSRNKSCGSFSIRTRASEVRVEASPGVSTAPCVGGGRRMPAPVGVALCLPGSGGERGRR